MSAPLADNEFERLAELVGYDVLDTDPEPSFDRLTRTAQLLFDVPISVLSLLDSHRQFFKSRVGLNVTGTPRAFAFCAYAIMQDEPMVVCDATADERFSDNPLVTGAPHIRFYAGAPLTTKGGHRLGTLCVIDDKTRPRPAARQLAALQDLADEAVDLLEARRTAKEAATLRADVSGIRQSLIAVTARRRKLEQTAALALDAGKMGFWEWDPHQRHLEWSENLFEIMGFGGQTTPPRHREWLARIHPADRLAIIRLKQKKAPTENFSLNFRLHHPDRGERRITVVGQRLVDRESVLQSVLGVVWDSTEADQKERSLKHSEELFRTLSASCPIGIFRTDPGGKTIYVNRRLEEIYGVAAELLLGDKWCCSVHPDDLHLLPKSDVLDAITMGTQTQREYRIIRPDGAVRWLHTRAALLRDLNGAPLGEVGTVDDVTERRCTLLELQSAKELAEVANRSKDLFLANVSHELRTPLNGVLGMADLLLETKLSDDQREMADIIRQSGNSLLSVLNDILDVSCIEAGNLLIQKRPFQWDVMMGQLMTFVENEAPKKGLGFELRQSPKVPKSFTGDAIRIKQILLAFVTNALKFTDHGGITIEALADNQDSTVSDLLITVRDTGPGIAPEEQPRLFRPFSQLDPSSTRKHGGVGLGLAIAKRVAELMGGTVGVMSTPGKGSTFWLRLSLPIDPPPAALILESQAGETASKHSPRILVVEDNPVNQAVALNVLRRLGWQAEVASTGRAAVEMIRLNQYAMVLMDCQMPDVDGYLATRQIRSWERAHKRTPMPIVALTAHALAEDRERCLAAGMNDYLAKPFGLDELRKALIRWADPAKNQVASERLLA